MFFPLSNTSKLLRRHFHFERLLHGRGFSPSRASNCSRLSFGLFSGVEVNDKGV